MKNIVLIFILFLLFSCSMVTINDCKNWYEIDSDKIPVELKNKNSYQIIYWIDDKIEYRLYANGFHPAQTTLQEKTANCANKALLALALNYIINNDKGQLVLCECKNQLHYEARIDYVIMKSTPPITKIYQIIEFDDIANYIYIRQGK